MSYQRFNPETGTTVIPIARHSESDNESTENELYPFGKPVALSGPSVQMAFVRKIWVILSGEFVIIIAASILFYLFNLRYFFQDYLWTWWVSIVVSFILLIALTYKSNDDFQPPWYLVLLYTCINAYVIGSLVVFLRLTFVLDTLVLMLVVSLTVVSFTSQSTYKFISKEPLILVLLAIIATSLILHPWVFDFYDLIPAFILALLLSIFFILDTWYLMRQMSKDEYWGASMQLYLDLVVPFKTIHHMCELTAEYDEDN